MTLKEVIKSEIIRIKSEERFEKGIEKGIELKTIEAIENMLDKGFDIKIIADLLGISTEKVFEVKETLESNREDKE